MSNTAGLAIPLHGPSRVANGHAATVDVNAVHYYWFGRRLWLAGLDVVCGHGTIPARTATMLATMAPTQMMKRPTTMANGTR